MAKGKRKAKTVRLTAFDRDALQSVARGLTIQQFITAFNLDPANASKRISALEAAGLLARDPADQNVIRITPDGYEKLAALAEKEKTREAAKQARLQAKTQENAARPPAPQALANAADDAAKTGAAPAGQSKPENPPEPPALPSPPSIPASALLRTAAPNREKQEAVDYIEILQEQQKLAGKRAPRKTRAIPALAPTPAEPTLPAAAMVEDDVAGENCELCKGGFRLAVSDASTGRYGHCFCGAPYHKACYDALLETGESKCVRCGKRLALMLDSQGEDAVRGVKKLFD